MSAAQKRTRGRRRTSRATRRLVFQILGVVLVVLAVVVYAFVGDTVRHRLGLAGAPLPRKQDSLRIVTWNLRKLSGDPATHDLARLAAQVRSLGADVVAVQEVETPDAIRELLPEYELVLSKSGGRGHQRLGLLWNPNTIEQVGEPIEHAGNCTAYWDGARRDAWKEPSLLDLVFVRDLRESLEPNAIAYPDAHCRRNACGELRSTDAYPDPDFAHVSDHCPVSLDLRRSDDD